MVSLIFRPLALAVTVFCGLAAPGWAQSSVDRGQYNATPPTLSDTALGNLQLDVNGNLKTVASGTPSGTQDVNLAKVNGVTTQVGAGAVGTGSARVAVGQDTTTIAGSAPGTAGTASANVVTVQGVASMTPVFTVGTIINPSANFTRPTDTNSYTSGDLVANNTSAGSVVPLSWTAARVAAGNFYIRRVRMQKSTTTTTNASFRVHFYTSSPTPANGDNGVWSTNISGYVGAVDITTATAFTDGATGNGVPNTGSEINIALSSGQTLYALIEARANYAPGNAEVFTVIPEIWQN